MTLPGNVSIPNLSPGTIGTIIAVLVLLASQIGLFLPFSTGDSRGGAGVANASSSMSSAPALGNLPVPGNSPAPAATAGYNHGAFECRSWGMNANDPRSNPAPFTPGQGVALKQSFTAAGRTSGYNVFDRGVDYSKPVGLVVRLHGDGAWEYDNPQYSTACMAAVAASHNMVLLQPKSPETPAPGQQVTWWRDMSNNHNWVISLVNHYLATNPSVDRNNIVWMGYSGGAEFISYSLLAKPTGLVNRATIMAGGGGANQYTRISGTPDPARQNAKHLWVVGTRDNGTTAQDPFDALSAAHRGHDYYSSRGFNTSREILDGVGHRDLPHPVILDRVLSSTSAR